MSVVVQNPRRAEARICDALALLPVATIHEAQGRQGLLHPRLRPIFRGAHIAGTAVTVRVPPGDNWMIHVAVEQCRPGDVLVVSPTSRSTAGYIGDLLATALATRGVRGAVIDAGCRDVATLERLRFPVWARDISAQGTVKETLGDVNIPMVCGDQLVLPGDVIIADDDGVVVVRRNAADTVLANAQGREASEAQSRERYRAGELSLDVHDMRGRLADAGLVYREEPPDGDGT